MLDVQQRYESLVQTRRELRWYALVDGYQYTQHTGQRIERVGCVNRALFDGTEDAPLAHAGPWLYDATRCPELIAVFADLELASPSLSWLITPLDLEGLAQLLQLKLDAALPGGRKALVRFYDPRVLGNLFSVMDAQQKVAFFHLIDEWHFMHNGQRVWTARSDAQPH